MQTIYLDHAATTPVHPEVLQVLSKAHQNIFGNPSSIHSFGRQARKYIDTARRVIAQSIGAKEQEIIFTSGGTESNNLAILGAALANEHKGKHLITTVQEHYATLDAFKYLQTLGFQVTYIDVNEDGQVSAQHIEQALTDETILVSVMAVNNETGVIQPIEDIGLLLKDRDIIFHTDAVQAYGNLALNIEKISADLLTISAHKINGPKGVGSLYVREGVQLQTLFFGGNQEGSRRPGTENVVSIVGFQRAVELMQAEMEKRKKQYANYKAKFLQVLDEENIEFQINGAIDKMVPTIVNISFPGCAVEPLLTNLDLEKLAVSSGSACTAGSIEYSHVLLAMYGQESERPGSSIRFSFGSHNTMEDILEAGKRVAKIVRRLTNL